MHSAPLNPASKKHLPRTALSMIIYCAVVSSVFLFLTSMNSPLFPLNTWVDENCFFSVGKALTQGQVLYADIYEQKGVLLYFLYAGAAVISSTTFIGVFILEIIAMTITLYYAAKIIHLFIPGSFAPLVLTPIFAVVLLTAPSYALGGSSEEICLPFIEIALFHLLDYFFGSKRYEPKIAFVDGCLAACVVWVKFSMVGFFLGSFLVIAASLIIHRNGKAFARGAGAIVLGAFAATLPWIVYFGLQGLIQEWIHGYFYLNIFTYQESLGFIERLVSFKGHLLSAFSTNAQFMVMSAIGIVLCLFMGKKSSCNARALARVSTLLPAVLLAFGIYFGSRAHPYYAFILAAFAPLGLAAIYSGIQHVSQTSLSLSAKKVTLAAVIICSLTFGYYGANCHAYRTIEKKDFPQFQFAEIMKQSENPTLLNYGFLDGGFYFAADIVPSCKYFCTLNNAIPDMIEEQKNYLTGRKVEYVVASQNTDTLLTSNYDLIATSTLHKQTLSFHPPEPDLTYYLYQKKA